MLKFIRQGGDILREYTNDILEKMHHLKTYNKLYSDFLIAMSNIYQDKDLDMLGKGITSNALLNRGFRLNDCLNFWEWDKYKKNKLLDLQRVNRCKDKNFCPNCRILSVSKDILAMKQFYHRNIDKYDFYLLTLTVPNIYPDHDVYRNHKNEIKFSKRFNEYVDKLFDNFKKFTLKYSSPDSSKNAYHGRSCQFKGGMRVLEVTYSKGRSGAHTGKYGFHPHFHVLVYVDKGVLSEWELEKIYKGKWSDNQLRSYCKNNDISYENLHITERERIVQDNELYNLKSRLDVELSIVWSMLWHGSQIKDTDIDAMGFDPKKRFLQKDGQDVDIKALEVDIRPIEDEKGIYEAIKYTFKLTDFKNFFEFSQMVLMLHKRKLRQPFGELYNMNFDELLVNEELPLELEFQEEAVKLYLRDMAEIFDFSDYRKISRFKAPIDKSLMDTL